MSDKPRGELFIWWTGDRDQVTADELSRIPDPVRVAYAERTGSALDRGSVISPAGVRDIAFTEWPATIIAEVARRSVGIAFPSRELSKFRGVAGIVTDLKIRMVFP